MLYSQGLYNNAYPKPNQTNLFKLTLISKIYSNTVFPSMPRPF
jgi:hypothetical protein